MNPKTDPNSAAFDYGLTKREYFAAMAMQGLLSDIETQRVINTTDNRRNAEFGEKGNFGEVMAINAVEFADALISALNKEVA